MIADDQPKIFANHPLEAKVSSLEDGEMVISRGQADEVVNNIRRFTNDQPLAQIICTYDRDDYARMFVVDQDTTLFDNSSANLLEYDALITSLTDLTLSLPVADCLAMVIYDPVQKVVALAHLGRHATVDVLVKKLIDKLVNDYSSSPADLLVYGSPSVKQSHYAMDYWDLADDPNWKDHVQQKDGKHHLDIPGFNRAQLLKSGVKPENIEISSINTATSENYGSHYQNSRDPAKSGSRFLVTVKLT